MTSPELLAEHRRQRRHRFVGLAVDTVLVVLSMTGVLALLNGTGHGSLLLTIAAAGVASTLVLGRFFGRTPNLGTALVTRVLLAGGCAVALARNAGTATEVLVAAVGTALLVAGLVGEPYLRRAVRFAPPLVAHLPGIPDTRGRMTITIPLLAASLAASLVGVLVAAVGASPWWFVAASAIALVFPAVAAVGGRSRIVEARRLRRTVSEAVADYAPEFVLYTSRPDDASSQVTLWLPYLKRAGMRFLIVTRNRTPAEALAQLTDVPIVEARKLSDLDGLVPPSLKAAFYVNASSGNGAFVRYQHLSHIYLGHGDSDKPPSYNPTHAMYDRIFAAGPAATRRYAAHGVHIPEEKFQIVGRPQVEGVEPASRPIAGVTEPLVLYAPTWRGHVEETLLYSLPKGEQIVSALLDRGATVIFRPHPFSYGFADDAAAIQRIQERLAADARETGRRHLFGAAAETERGILDCVNASDAMVSDVSSVVSDYLFSGKPFAMVAVPSEPERFVSEYPVAQAAYVIRGDLGNVGPVLSEMLGADPLAAQRASIRVDYLGDFPAEQYADAFVDAVRLVSSKPTEEEDEVDNEEADEPSAVTQQGGLLRYRRLLVGFGLNLSGSFFALCSLTAALLAAPPAVVLVTAVLSQAPALQLFMSDTSGRRRWDRLLRLMTVEPPRAMLLVVVAIEAVGGPLFGGSSSTGGDGGSESSDPVVAVGWLVALTLVAVALAGEQHVRAAWGQLGLQVHGLPAVRARISEVVPHGVLSLLSSVVVVLLVVLATLGAPPWLALVLGLLFFAVYLDVVVRALLRFVRVLAAEARLRDGLLDYAPQFALYFASTVGAAYQMGMWLPFMLRLGRPFIIVTRNVPMMREIAQLTDQLKVDVPVIQRPTLRSLEDVVVPTLTTCFYVNNAVRNAHFVERRELTHVWLNHGDSEKPACYNPVHAIYDLLFAAGQAGVDRYARHGITIPAGKFRIVGRPQVEAIEAARGPVREQQPPTVLYAPTWQGPFADTRVYSLPMGRQIVEGLLARGVRVIFRAHPFNYRFQASVDSINDIGRLLASDRAKTGRQHIWGAAAEQQMSIEDCFNASDAMVSDVSAVVSDYLRSDKPFAIVSVGRTPEQLMKEAPAARAAYVIQQDLANLDEVYRQLLGDDPLAAVRRETKIYYLGDFDPDHYADGFLDAAREVIDAGRHAQGRPDVAGG